MRIFPTPAKCRDASLRCRTRTRPTLRRQILIRPTVVATTSPLVLEWCDEVAYLVDGRVAAVGRHRELLHRDAGYRAVVTRGEAELVGADAADGEVA